MSCDRRTVCPQCKACGYPSEGHLHLKEYHQSFGIDNDGTFVIDYFCSCDNCNFKWEYQHKIKVPVYYEKQ